MIFSNFHFLRPYFLLAFIPMMLLLYLLWRRKNFQQLWGSIIDPHLLKHLVIESSEKKRNRPFYLFILILFITIIALAGPSFDREPSPFAEDQASLVIIVEVTPSMLAQDVQPSRLQRAAQKIKDLLEMRKGSKTALIAYAGSAHLVMPFTSDGEIVSSFATELSPKIMPKEGDNLKEALLLAQKILQQNNHIGSIVVMNDGVHLQQVADMQSQILTYSTHFYSVVAPLGQQVPLDSPPVIPLDKSALNKFAKLLKGSVTEITVDKSDLESLNSRIKTSINVSLQEGGTRWRDSGYWLVPILVVLSLMWFGKGWQITYE